jgi:hypothetical protein
MAKRGRKSAAEMAIANLVKVTSTARVEPPYDIFDEQADLFRAIVDSLPADWFSTGSVPLLAQLCKHVVASRRVAELIAQAERTGPMLDIEMYDRLLRLQERQSAAVHRLATALRLTNQSRYTPGRAATASAVAIGPKPWEFGRDVEVGRPGDGSPDRSR